MIGKIFVRIFVALCVAQVLNARTIPQVSNSSKKIDLGHIFKDLEHHLEIIAEEAGGNIITSVRCLEQAQPSLRELERLTLKGLGECQGRHDCEHQLLEKIFKLEAKIVNDFHRCLILRTSTQVLTKTPSIGSSESIDLGNVLTDLEHQLETVAKQEGGNVITSVRCLERAQPSLRELERLTLQGLGECQGRHDCEQQLLEKITKLKAKIVNDFHKCLIFRTTKSTSSNSLKKEIDLEQVQKELEHKIEIVAKEAGADLKTSIRCLNPIQPSLRNLQFLYTEGLDQCESLEVCEDQILNLAIKLEEQILNDYQNCVTV